MITTNHPYKINREGHSPARRNPVSETSSLTNFSTFPLPNLFTFSLPHFSTFSLTNFLTSPLLHFPTFSLTNFFTSPLKHLLTSSLITLLLLTFSTTLTAQNNKSLHLIARPLQDSILLRWAPANYATWQLANQYGYNLVRYTVVRDSAMLDIRERIVLTSAPIKPLELNRWEPLAKNNNFGAIAAQAIYGETFEINASEGLTPEKIATKSREQKQRFSYALFAADMSPDVAKASGLWYTDGKARKNEKYLYRLFLNLPDSLKTESDTAFVFTGIAEYTPLPLPFELSIKMEEKAANLKWNVFVHDNIYMGWEVERSDNKGRTYKALSDEPIISITSDEVPSEHAYKVDSLPEYNKEYQYRIRGISSFGERGPWSEPVKGIAKETLKGYPVIKEYSETGTQVTITWEFPVEDERLIEGFRLIRSPDGKNPFTTIEGNIKPTGRSLSDKQPIPTAYYKVQTFGNDTKEKESPIYLVQMIDSIPPAPPVDIIGVADSSGKIHLSWKANTETDILGYMVFKSASGKDEYSLITNKPVSESMLTDSIAKNDLNSGVYYSLMAVDQRYNQSDFSEVVYVSKVDKIPPSFPVLNSCKALPEGIELKWINSTSSDVDRHEIIRHFDGDSTWTKLGEIKNKKYTLASLFIDSKADAGRIARYKIRVVDKAGNFSESEASIDIKALKSRNIEKIGRINKRVDIENGKIALSWKLPENEVNYFKIYRKTSDVNYTVYETLDGNKNNFEDYGMKAGKFYAYRIKIIYASGSVSGFSDEVRIDF